MRNDRYGGGFQRSIAPVKVGDELDVKIEAVGEKGDGIAKKDGFVLFVPGTKAGQNVKIRVTRVLQKVGFAEAIGQAEAADSNDSGQDSSQENSESYDAEEPSEDSSSSEDSENFGEEEQ